MDSSPVSGSHLNFRCPKLLAQGENKAGKFLASLNWLQPLQIKYFLRKWVLSGFLWFLVFFDNFVHFSKKIVSVISMGAIFTKNWYHQIVSPFLNYCIPKKLSFWERFKFILLSTEICGLKWYNRNSETQKDTRFSLTKL